MKYKVLAIDDSTTLLEVMEFAFEKHEISVEGVSSLEACKEKLRHNKYDVILYDLNFKEMNGITFARYLKEELKIKTPIFIMSNHQKHEIKLQAKEAGAEGWIQKPFIADLLGKKIRKFIKYEL